MTEILLPKRMRALAKDHRGYPIPFIVQRDASGCPLFTVNDVERQRRCVTEGRCPICGNRLDKTKWLVGGPLSAFHPNGAYLDSAMHYECMEYALKVCPYLAMRPHGMPDLGKLASRLEGRVVVDPTMLPGAPPVFVAVACYKFTYMPQELQYHVRPERPYLAVEYWRAGQQMSEEEALPLIAQSERYVEVTK